MPFVSRNSVMCSSNLHDVQVSEMGLKSDGSSLLPVLGIGATFAFFQSSGSFEEDTDLRKTSPRYRLHHSA